MESEKSLVSKAEGILNDLNTTNSNNLSSMPSNSTLASIPETFLTFTVPNNTDLDNLSQLQEGLPSSFLIMSLAEIKKKISGYHEFYSAYINNIYTHMSSNKDLRNLTIFLISVLGILGVFIFKAYILDNVWGKFQKGSQTYTNYRIKTEKKPLLLHKAKGEEEKKRLDLHFEDDISSQTNITDKILLNGSILNDSLISIKNILNEHESHKSKSKKFDFEEESLNIDIEKFLSELNEPRVERTAKSSDSERLQRQKEEEINKLGEEIVGDK